MRPAGLRSLLALGLSLGAVGCGARSAQPTGQILLYVDTDAPMPAAAPQPLGPMDPLPLFDRVRIDVYPPAATMPCSGCTNDFELTSDLLQMGASVGLVPAAGVSGYVADVRLYKGAFASPEGAPDPNTTVDVTVSLPVVGALGIDEETVLLATSGVGQPVGSLSAPVATTPGRPQGSMVGTWSPAQRVPCRGAADTDEVCVPGGAYWMGNPLARDIDVNDEGTKPRLVVLAPYFLRKTEVTVASFRAAAPPPVNVWSTGTSGSEWTDWCTFAASPRSCTQGFPCDEDALNCATWSEARAFCQGQGGDLPTEAQYEFAASGFQSLLYVWGEDTPVCGDAVYGQGAGSGNGDLISDLAGGCPQRGFGGSTVPGKGKLDQLSTPDGTIVDLAGNLEEWARDMWNRQDEPCWSMPGIYTNPLCATVSPADGVDHPVRGASWLDEGLDLHAATRTAEGIGSLGQVAQQGDVGVGFRCVRPGG